MGAYYHKTGLLSRHNDYTNRFIMNETSKQEASGVRVCEERAGHAYVLPQCFPESYQSTHGLCGSQVELFATRLRCPATAGSGIAALLRMRSRHPISSARAPEHSRLLSREQFGCTVWR